FVFFTFYRLWFLGVDLRRERRSLGLRIEWCRICVWWDAFSQQVLFIPSHEKYIGKLMAPNEKSSDIRSEGKDILVQVGEDSVKVPLRFFNHLLVFHRLQPTTKQLGDFVGEFLEYDSKSLSTSLRSFMRIRVLLDVRRPLKRRKMIMCMLGHSDSFCQIRMLREEENVEMGWDLSPRAQSRKVTMMSSFWLKEEGEGEPQRGKVGRENKESVRKGSSLKMDLVLGINLDKDVRDTFDMVGNTVKNKGQVDMDHDGEENPIEGGEGN
ncbi:hypothetical protein Gorai_004526, partial [Gossypium raimondii]|nr:hypothetical protein [Gossypium raimondii]